MSNPLGQGPGNAAQVSGLVSVVIPTFNRAALCRRAVESVFSQTYDQIEVIVIDDGSTDDTGKLLDRCAGPLRYFRQDRAGVSTARNNGLALCQGEFVAFLDSDDEWLAWKVDAEVAVLRRFPEVGMVWSDMTAVDDGGRVVDAAYLRTMYSAYRHFVWEELFDTSVLCGKVWPDCPPTLATRRAYVGDLFSPMFMGNLVHTSTVLLRRSTQREVGYFDVDLELTGEDYDFHLRTCRAAKVAYLDVSTIRYRTGAVDQLTSQSLNRWMARNNLTTITRVLERDRSRLMLSKAVIRRRVADSWAWVGRAELNGDRRAARRAFRTSLRWRRLAPVTAGGYLLSFLSPRTVARVRHAMTRLRAFAARYRARNYPSFDA